MFTYNLNSPVDSKIAANQLEDLCLFPLLKWDIFGESLKIRVQIRDGNLVLRVHFLAVWSHKAS